MGQLQLSSKGRAFIEGFEGLELQAYKDIAGIVTIGYGHTGPDVFLGKTITQPEADQLMALDVHVAVAAVNHLVQIPINQNQFDSLVSFTYNLGSGSLMSSHLLVYVNQSNFAAAVLEFPKWVHAGGKTSEGLIRRRAAEAALFQEPV